MIKYLLIWAMILGYVSSSQASGGGEKPKESKPAHEEVKSIYPTIQVENVDANLKIPSKLWEQIENLFYNPHQHNSANGHGAKEEHGETNEHAESDDTNGKKSLPLENLTYRVELVEKTSGVMKQEGHNLEFPPGGGILDFKEFLTGKKGSFYLKIILPSEFQGNSNTKVYFLSSAKKRMIENRVFGAGCGVYLDITNFFQQSMAKEGILTNTSDFRYASVLSGTYIFTATKDDKLLIAQLTITDSRYPVLMCPKR